MSSGRRGVYVGSVAEDVDIAASGLLDGLEGEARAERAELVEWLLHRGFSVDQIRHALAPVLLPARRLVGDDGRLVSAREVCERAGMDLEVWYRFMRAMGLPIDDDPDAPVYPRADAEAAAFAQRFIALGLDADQLIPVTRTLAEGLGRAAEEMRHAALSTVLDPTAREVDVARSAEALVAATAPLLEQMIQEMLRLQLRRMMETEAVTASERAEGRRLPGARPVTIGFADLVGFTRLGELVPPEDLERLAGKLVETAGEVVEPPVRLVKTIGDAVMLAGPDPGEVVDDLLALVEAAADDDEFPRLRAGAATGMAVSRAGDWYGSPVNLASRVTGVARPGSVLVAESTHDALRDDPRFTWSFAGARRLKGIKNDVKLFRVRRAGTRPVRADPPGDGRT